MEKEKICFEDLGLMEYKKAWDYQESLFKKIWKSNRLFIRFRMLQIQNSLLPHNIIYYLPSIPLFIH
jgi:hypothetical protein